MASDATRARIAALRLRVDIAKAGPWDEEKHPRFPKGDPQGGQFAPGSLGEWLSGFFGGKKPDAIGTPSDVADPNWAASKGPQVPWHNVERKGSLLHPFPDDKGKPAFIHRPSEGSSPSSEAWTDPDRVLSVVPGQATPAALNGVPLKAAGPAENWQTVAGQNPQIEHGLPDLETIKGMHAGAGVIIEEPDGRVWLTKPLNGFGGYKHTFPKGTQEPGLTLQQTAIKEAWEETGLKVELTGVLGDFKRTTSVARYYLAKRVGGSPSAQGWESQAMRLVPHDKVISFLNMPVDRDIWRAYKAEDDIGKAREPFLDRSALHALQQRIDKLSGRTAAPSDPFAAIRKAYDESKHPRWPKGSPLGGQFMALDAQGLPTPPKIGSAANPGYQKKADLAYAAAQAGDTAKVKALLDSTAGPVAKYGYTEGAHPSVAYTPGPHSNAKWTQQTHQYLAELYSKSNSATLATLSTDNPDQGGSAPADLAQYKKIGGTLGGSSAAGQYVAPDGTKYYVKGTSGQGVQTADRAKNEVLASKLMLAAGAGAPEMHLVTGLPADLGGPKATGVASKMVDGVKLTAGSGPQALAAARADFAVHAWLGNRDVVGLSFDNTIIDANGKAVNIDPGGSLLHRAQGLPMYPDLPYGNMPHNVQEWDTLRNGVNKQASAIYGGMTKSDLVNSAQKLAGLDDNTISDLVAKYGPGTPGQKLALAADLIARRDDVLKKAGITVMAAPKLDSLKAGLSPALQSIKVEDVKDLAVYHGTNEASKADIETNGFSIKPGQHSEGVGVYVTPNPKVTDQYGKAQVAAKLTGKFAVFGSVDDFLDHPVIAAALDKANGKPLTPEEWGTDKIAELTSTHPEVINEALAPLGIDGAIMKADAYIAVYNPKALSVVKAPASTVVAESGGVKDYLDGKEGHAGGVTIMYGEKVPAVSHPDLQNTLDRISYHAKAGDADMVSSLGSGVYGLAGPAHEKDAVNTFAQNVAGKMTSDKAAGEPGPWNDWGAGKPAATAGYTYTHPGTGYAAGFSSDAWKPAAENVAHYHKLGNPQILGKMAETYNAAAANGGATAADYKALGGLASHLQHNLHGDDLPTLTEYANSPEGTAAAKTYAEPSHNEWKAKLADTGVDPDIWAAYAAKKIAPLPGTPEWDESVQQLSAHGYGSPSAQKASAVIKSEMDKKAQTYAGSGYEAANEARHEAAMAKLTGEQLGPKPKVSFMGVPGAKGKSWQIEGAVWKAHSALAAGDLGKLQEATDKLAALAKEFPVGSKGREKVRSLMLWTKNKAVLAGLDVQGSLYSGYSFAVSGAGNAAATAEVEAKAQAKQILSDATGFTIHTLQPGQPLHDHVLNAVKAFHAGDDMGMAKSMGAIAMSGYTSSEPVYDKLAALAGTKADKFPLATGGQTTSATNHFQADADKPAAVRVTHDSGATAPAQAKTVVDYLEKSPVMPPFQGPKKPYYDNLATKMQDAYATGDPEALKAVTEKFGQQGQLKWPAETINGKMMTAWHSQLQAQLGSAQAAHAAAALAEPVGVIPVPGASVSNKPAMPDFNKAKLADDNTNAASHNKKVDAISALASKGDVKGLLALSYATNTYGKKQAKLANDALAALGSPFQVDPGQKKGMHSALSMTGLTAEQLTGQSAIKSAKLSPTELPPDVNFMTGNGGKGISSVAAVNKANQQAFDNLKAMALAGDYEGVKNATFQLVDKTTGAPSGAPIKINSGHQFASQHLVNYQQTVVDGMYEKLNPPSPLEIFQAKQAASSVAALAAQFPPVKLGANSKSMPSSQTMQHYIAIGQADPTGAKALVPKKTIQHSDGDAWTQQAKQDYKTWQNDSKAEAFRSAVQGHGGHEYHKGWDKPSDVAYETSWGSKKLTGQDLMDRALAAHKWARELESGTKIYKWEDLSAGTMQKLATAQPGLIIQNPAPACASYHPTATKGFGPSHRWTFIAAPGAKALNSFGSGALSHEREVTMLPNYRMMIVGHTKAGAGKSYAETTVLLLPPDPKLNSDGYKHK